MFALLFIKMLVDVEKLLTDYVVKLVATREKYRLNTIHA
jgi:hypothetical protein